MSDVNFGIALLPKKPTVAEINEYANIIAANFPQTKILIATRDRPNEDMEILHKNPRVSIFHTTKEPLDIVAGGYCLMATARALEIQWLFFNIGMKRNPAQNFCKFINNSAKYMDFAHLVYGVPPIFREKAGMLTDSVGTLDAPRHRLFVDLFLNYVFTVTLDMPFTNINAGMFGARRDAIKYLLSVGNYEDSSLLCPQMIWHLQRNGDFAIREVHIDNVILDNLGFSMAKAAREIAFVLSERGRIGRWKELLPLVNEFLAEHTRWNQWMTQADKDWFLDCMVPAAQELLKL